MDLPIVPPVLCPSCGGMESNIHLPLYIQVERKIRLERLDEQTASQLRLIFFNTYKISNPCCRARMMFGLLPPNER